MPDLELPFVLKTNMPPEVMARAVQRNLEHLAGLAVKDSQQLKRILQTLEAHGIEIEDIDGEAEDTAAVVAGIDGTLNAHVPATTTVHGIGDTAVLETQSGAQTKVNTHRDAADPHADRAVAAAALSSHEADATAIHGIANTAVLETQSGAQTRVDTHAGLTTHIRIAEPPPVIHVSTTGDNSFDGRVDRPKLTVASALAALPGAGGTVQVGPGTHIANFTLDKGRVTIRGVGTGYEASGGTILKTTAGDLITIGNPAITCDHIVFEDISLWAAAGAGHIFKQVGFVAQSTFQRVTAKQDVAAKRVWDDSAGHGYLENTWRDFELWHVPVGTAGAVNPFYLKSPNGDINVNEWNKGRVTYSAEHFFFIENTAAGTYAYDNVFRGINWEITNGGCFKGIGVFSTTFEDCNVYDTPISGDITKDLYVFDKNASNILTRHTVFSRCQRRGGALAAGIRDIKFVTGGTKTAVLTGLESAVLTGYEVDLGGALGVTAFGNGYNVLFLNPAADTVFVGNSTRSMWFPATHMALDSGVGITVGSAPYVARVIKLADGATQGFFFAFQVPEDFIGDRQPTVTIEWAPVSTATGAVRWQFNIGAVYPGEDITQTSVQQNWTGGSAARTAGRRVSDTQIMSAALPYQNRWVKLSIRRVGADAADTLASDVHVLGIRVDYPAR